MLCSLRDEEENEFTSHHISRGRVCLMNSYIITFHIWHHTQPPPPVRLSHMFSKELFHSPTTSMWESEQTETGEPRH